MLKLKLIFQFLLMIIKKLDSKINKSFMKSSMFLFGCECYNLESVLFLLLIFLIKNIKIVICLFLDF